MSVEISRETGGIKIKERIGAQIFETHLIHSIAVQILVEITNYSKFLRIESENFHRQFIVGDITSVNGINPPQDLRDLADLLRDNVFRNESMDQIIEAIEGIPGNTSGNGGGRPTFDFHQSTVATTWTINHNLGYYPNIVIVDTANTVIYGDITYVDANNIDIEFAIPIAGIAFLS